MRGRLRKRLRTSLKLGGKSDTRFPEDNLSNVYKGFYVPSPGFLGIYSDPYSFILFAKSIGVKRQDVAAYHF